MKRSSVMAAWLNRGSSITAGIFAIFTNSVGCPATRLFRFHQRCCTAALLLSAGAYTVSENARENYRRNGKAGTSGGLLKTELQRLGSGSAHASRTAIPW